MDLWVADTSGHQCIQYLGESLCLPPQAGMSRHEVIGEVSSTCVHLMAMNAMQGKMHPDAWGSNDVWKGSVEAGLNPLVL